MNAWTAWLPVSSSGLRRRTLVMPDWSIAKATLFPFFSRQGMISRVMVVSADLPQIWFFDPNQAELGIPLLGPIALRPVPSTMRLLDGQQLALVNGLWHFDPRRVLDDPKYAQCDAAQSLKESNCLERFPWPVSGIYYRRDLSRVSLVLRRRKQGADFPRFPANELPERPSSPPQRERKPKAATAWRLEPFWMRAKR